MLQLQAVPVVSGSPVPSDSAACGQDSESRSTQPSSSLIFSSATFLCCYGQWIPGGPKLRYMDHIRRILNKSNFPISDLEKLATDRDTWRSACASSLSTLRQVSDQAAADRRSRRHHRCNPTATGPRCPQCSRECASEFGLRSHLRSHISRPSQRC